MWGVTPRPGHPYFAGAPLLIAHRGGSALAPENTLIAFDRAVHWWGADLLELDVQPTRDGHAVVFHDSVVDRVTNGTGPVAAFQLTELRQLDAGFRFTPDEGRTFPFRGSGIGIPTLPEVLDAFPGTRINIEIKDPKVRPAVECAIRDARANGRVLIAAGRKAHRSGLNGHSGPVSAAQEEIARFYLLHRLGLARFHRPAIDALQIPERYRGLRLPTPRLVRDAHALNLPVHVWTVDEPEAMHRLLDAGVDGIVTDRPDRLARVLHARGARPAARGPAAGEAEPFYAALARP